MGEADQTGQPFTSQQIRFDCQGWHRLALFFIDWRLTVVCFLSQAEEVTSKKRFSNAMLRIDVGTMNGFSPRLVAEALEGFVEENSPVGTPVISARRKGQPLQLKVVEEDPVRLLVLLLFVL